MATMRPKPVQFITCEIPVDSSAAYGVTKVRLRVNQKQCERPGINPNPCSSPYAAGGADHDRLNLAHFRALDRVVAHLEARGVAADLMPFEVRSWRLTRG